MKENEQIMETIRKMQKIVYAILCDIDDFCRENGIVYFLSGGSCLGAVRHQGFIPWDDDADIMLPREDYDRFIPLFLERFKDKYGVGELRLSHSWNLQYGVIWDLKTRRVSQNLNGEEVGIGVDVFPIDGLPEEESARKRYYQKIDLLRGLSNAAVRKNFLDTEKKRLIKTIAHYAAKPFGPHYFAEKIDKLARKYPFQTAKYVGASVAAHYGEKETIRKEQMSSATYRRFEDREFPIPVGYDEYLSNLYGDYMQLPKDADRKIHLVNWVVEFDTDKT